MLHLMRQTMPRCFGASVAVTTLHIRNGAFHTEQFKAGLATDHSWTHFSTYGFCDCKKSGRPKNARKYTEKERELTQWMGVATQLKERINTTYGCSNTIESSGVLAWQCRTAKSEHPAAAKKKPRVLFYCSFCFGKAKFIVHFALEKLLFRQIREESNFGCLRMGFNSPHSTLPITHKPTNSTSLLCVRKSSLQCIHNHTHVHTPSPTKRGERQEQCSRIKAPGVYHKMAWATTETVPKPGHQLPPNSTQQCSSIRSSCGIKILISNQAASTHVRLKRRRHLHTSSGFDRFVVIYSVTCRIHTRSIPDGCLLNAKVNRSVCITLNIYIKEASFFPYLNRKYTQVERPKLKNICDNKW